MERIRIDRRDQRLLAHARRSEREAAAAPLVQVPQPAGPAGEDLLDRIDALLAEVTAAPQGPPGAA